jgi:hypothetical protein
MKTILIAITLLIFAALTLGPSTVSADELRCKSKGNFVRCSLPNANRLHVSLSEELSNHKCEKGHTWGADSDGIWVDRKCKGLFYFSGEGGRHHDYEDSYNRHDRRSGSCPSDLGGNECEYYKDGYKLGKEDGQNSMSSVYERYSDYYDSRFERYFSSGYRDGWNDYR